MRSPERIVLATDLVSVGMFRCPPDHEAFPGGFVDNWLVVFPRTSARIERDETPPVVADPTVVVLYEPPSRYSRFVVDPRGDLCDYFAVAADATDDLSGTVGLDVVQRFREGHRRAGPQVYLTQRRLFETASEPGADPVAIEEGVLAVVAAVLAETAQPATPEPQRATTRARHRDLALSTAEMLAASFEEPLKLRQIARRVGSSPHHLSRIFQRETGTSIHERLLELRLKRALEILRDGDPDLARLAVDLGFSSHSHFSRSFKKTFGVSPRDYRSESPETRTIVQAIAS